MGDEQEAAHRLLAKLRDFVEDLDEDERLVFAALVGPGIALAYRNDEVEGFGLSWEPQRLPEHLAEAIRTRGLRIEGLAD